MTATPKSESGASCEDFPKSEDIFVTTKERVAPKIKSPTGFVEFDEPLTLQLRTRSHC